MLYALIAFAFWRILTIREGTPYRLFASAAFLTQLILNLAWSIVFFGLHSLIAALAVIVFLIVAILACIIAFQRMDTTSALLMVPYAVWVGYAMYLNASVWWLNR